MPFRLLAIIGALMLMSFILHAETLLLKTLTSLRNQSFSQLLCLAHQRQIHAVYFVPDVLLRRCLRVFITGSPFVYITYFGVDPQHYGWLFAVNIVGLMAVSMVNRRLVHRYPLEALLRNAVFIAAIAAIVLAVTTGLA
jgi:DHA1 family bicyclomycin/chloramphenicol resistance-like MFS transporter